MKKEILVNAIKVLNKEHFGDAFIQTYASENGYRIGVHDCNQKSTIHDKHSPNGLAKIAIMLSEIHRLYDAVLPLVKEKFLESRYTSVAASEKARTDTIALYADIVPDFTNWLKSLVIEQVKASKPTEKPKFKFIIPKQS